MFLKTFRQDDQLISCGKRSHRSQNSLCEHQLSKIHQQKNMKQYYRNQEIVKTMSKNQSFIDR